MQFSPRLVRVFNKFQQPHIAHQMKPYNRNHIRKRLFRCCLFSSAKFYADGFDEFEILTHYTGN
jgi:hypothetical protein